MCCGEKKLLWSGSILLVVGVLFWVIATWGVHFIDSKLDSGIKDEFLLTSHKTKGFKDWESDVPEDSAKTFYSIYMFNVTNSWEVTWRNAKPHLVEVGPYVYREYTDNIDVSFDREPYPGGLHSISFTPYVYFKFDEERSGPLHETDVFCQPNLAFWGVYSKVKDTPAFAEYLVEAIASLEGDEVYANHTVHELMWGYKDPLLALLQPLLPTVITTDMVEIKHNYSDADDARKLAKRSRMMTGEDDINRMFELVMWKDSAALVDEWALPEIIDGTDGKNFQIDLDKNRSVKCWVDDIYRVQKMVYQKEVVVDGITLYKYIMEPHSMDNATLFPLNAKYYQMGPSGVFNLSSCPPGAPIFLSKPHWLDADPIYFPQTTGLTPPTTELYETHIDIEPLTGNNMNTHKRMQINLQIESSPMFPNVTNIMHPVLWLDEHGHLTWEQAKKFKESVYAAQHISNACYLTGWIVGTIFVAISIPLLYFHAKKAIIDWETSILARGRYNEPLINKVDSFGA
jgi:hypothetical protein